MNILITGANGFLGSYFRRYFSYDKIFWGTTSSKIGKDCFKFDRNYSNITEILKNIKIDIILHNASVIPMSFDKADLSLFLDNTEMTGNIVEYAITNKVKKVLFISSYGSIQGQDITDINDYYTLSKRTGEKIINMLGKYNIESGSFRISSPFGEYNNRSTVLNMFIKKSLRNEVINVYGTGNRKQNFIYAGNIRNCIIICLKNKVNGVYDLVGSHNITMLELAQIIVRLTKSKSEIVVGAIDDPLEYNILPDYSLDRVKSELHYEEEYSFESGIVRLIKWIKANEISNPI